ncbi:MAG: hypothetical protein E2O39_17705 [Planctomycetota bacterium]|nr:MAG: hypothetical protein E2O39_17705 [Planctomycetota bacterium]
MQQHFELHVGRIARLVTEGRLSEGDGRETLCAVQAILESGEPGAGGLFALSRAAPFSLDALLRAQLMTGNLSPQEYSRPLRARLTQAGAFVGLAFGATLTGAGLLAALTFDSGLGAVAMTALGVFCGLAGGFAVGFIWPRLVFARCFGHEVRQLAPPHATQASGVMPFTYRSVSES